MRCRYKAFCSLGGSLYVQLWRRFDDLLVDCWHVFLLSIAWLDQRCSRYSSWFDILASFCKKEVLAQVFLFSHSIIQTNWNLSRIEKIYYPFRLPWTFSHNPFLQKQCAAVTIYNLLIIEPAQTVDLFVSGSVINMYTIHLRLIILEE